MIVGKIAKGRRGNFRRIIDSVIKDKGRGTDITIIVIGTWTILKPRNRGPPQSAIVWKKVRDSVAPQVIM